MEQQRAAFLAVAAVVAVVGLGLFFMGGGPAAPTATATPTPGLASGLTPSSTGTPTPAATPAQTATATPDPAATPTPFNDSVQRYSFDGPALNRSHVARLAAVGNYTARSNLTIDGESYTNHVNVSYVMDLQDDREYSVQVFTYRYENGEDEVYPVVWTFTDENTTWERRQERTGQRNSTVESDTEPYRGEVEPVNTTLALDIGEIATGVVDRSNWTLTGNSTRDGVRLFRFETSGRHLDAAVPGNVTGGEATFVVGEDGIVRYIAYDFTAVEDGSRTRYVYESFYGRLGETSVPRPEWAD
ncbi:DUF7537 family lipoprotein [Halorarius litoreus]|uniref:DUF7537 family lipoprotein n=1 Tax=Halorarius litoreus TaxID=2962676 RepID=UPI0020CE342B|nr:hypothetical protein [Halorarius litoreus]